MWTARPDASFLRRTVRRKAPLFRRAPAAFQISDAPGWQPSFLPTFGPSDSGLGDDSQPTFLPHEDSLSRPVGTPQARSITARQTMFFPSLRFRCKEIGKMLD